MGLVAKNYQGKVFEENACQKHFKSRLLNVDLICGYNPIQHYTAIIKIVDDCFPVKSVSQILREDVEENH